MALSRKRRRELKKLRKLTGNLLHEQKEVFSSAGEVIGKAGKQVRHLSNEHIAPRIETVGDLVRPVLNSTANLIKRAGNGLRAAAQPVASNTLQHAVNVLENQNRKGAAKKLTKYGQRIGLLKKSRRGGIIGLIIGLLVAAGVGFSLWQAFRDDEELWIAPESKEKGE
ncbi:MAG: DNA/RNA helicase [Microbacteriaceae bacterium]|nr:DNA/RNA helicase [Microbacteriaceae bacterium]